MSLRYFPWRFWAVVGVVVFSPLIAVGLANLRHYPLYPAEAVAPLPALPSLWNTQSWLTTHPFPVVGAIPIGGQSPQDHQQPSGPSDFSHGSGVPKPTTGGGYALVQAAGASRGYVGGGGASAGSRPGGGQSRGDPANPPPGTT